MSANHQRAKETSSCKQHGCTRAGSRSLLMAEASPLAFWPFDTISDVNERVKHGQVAGRAVLTPSI